MKYNIAICDDENIILKVNATYIHELVKRYKVDADIMCFNNGEALIKYAAENQVNAVFLDIDMDKMNGIQTAECLLKLNPQVVTVFITGHREFAYEAFTVEALGYLIKPFELKSLERIFKRAILQIKDNYKRKNKVPIVIMEDNLKKKIRQNNICYVEKEGSRSIIVTKTERHAIYESISSLSERLEDNFVRVSQGVIVN